MITAAIIGHGRSAEGKGWGPRIDACDIVVRLWNCQWQNVVDYGKKYDYGMFQVAPSLWPPFYDKLRRGEIPQPRRWVASYLKGPRPPYPERTLEIDQSGWAKIGQSRFGGAGVTGKLRLTRGTIAGCWVLSLGAGEVHRCVLVGFDNVLARKQLPIEASYSKIYRERGIVQSFAAYREGETKSGNHDFAVEYKVMQYFAQKNGVELVDARAVWS